MILTFYLFLLGYMVFNSQHNIELMRQNIYYYGRLESSSTARPIPQAKIVIYDHDTPTEVYSDNNGEFFISSRTEKDLLQTRVRIEALGFEGFDDIRTLVPEKEYIQPISINPMLSVPEGWILTDRFDLGEDQSSHQWQSFGGGFVSPFYTCGNDRSWRNYGGSFTLRLKTRPDHGFALVWRTDGIGTRRGHRSIFNVYINEELFQTYSGQSLQPCSYYLILVPSNANIRIDEEITVRVDDTGEGVESTVDFSGSHIWLYVQEGENLWQ